LLVLFTGLSSTLALASKPGAIVALALIPKENLTRLISCFIFFFFVFLIETLSFFFLFTLSYISCFFIKERLQKWKR
jgi:hypothetical protein